MTTMFYSFRHYNFRLWFVASLLSNSGTWIQRVSQSWLVLTVLTANSSLHLGLVTAMQFVPLLCFSPWAGSVVDRVNIRYLVQICQTCTGLCGLVMAVMIYTDSINLAGVYLFAFLAGLAQSFDGPARQAFISALVPHDKLPNAVALNSVAFNSARLAGPAFAGLIIEWWGIAEVFFLNAFLFLITVIVIFLLKQSQLLDLPHADRKQKHKVQAGLKYIAIRSDIIMIFVVLGVISMMGLNFQVTSALMATEVYGKQAGEYGLMNSFLSLGALAGALLATRREYPRLRLLFFYGFGSGVFLTLISLMPTYAWFLLFAIPLGLCNMTLITTANSAIQISTKDEYRGRVLSIYLMIFQGVTPIGSSIIGWVGEEFGARWSMAIGGISSISIVLIVGIWGFFRYHYRIGYNRKSHHVDIAPKN